RRPSWPNGSGSPARPSIRWKMACSLPPPRSRSNLPRHSTSASSSCSGSNARFAQNPGSDIADLADKVALGLVHVGQVHAPAGEEHAQDADLAADMVGPFFAGLVVGADPQIAALTVVDTFRRDEALGPNEGRR